MAWTVLHRVRISCAFQLQALDLARRWHQNAFKKPIHTLTHPATPEAKSCFVKPRYGIL